MPPDSNGPQIISSPTEVRVIKTAGSENLARLESNLSRNQAALRYLFDQGLTAASIKKFHLGIKEPYQRKGDGKVVRDALCYPVIARDGEPLGRYGCLAIPGLTEQPHGQSNWGSGKPLTYYSGSIESKTMLLVAGSCQELWVIDERLASSPLANKVVVIAPSHGFVFPGEWKRPNFWGTWGAVYFAQGTDPAGEKAARDLARCCGREVFRVRVPAAAGRNWVEFFKSGGTGEEFLGLVNRAQVLSSPAPEESDSSDRPGEFAANPVNINGAFVNGHLYYPFTVERREMEEVVRSGKVRSARLVTSYVTKVVRSDGAVLDIVRLPAPRGTPHERQVLALTDGTRIEKALQPSHYATWQLDSIQAFIKAMQGRNPAPHRPLKDLLDDVASHLRRSVWLPYGDDYTILALYVALSFVYQVFEAIPLIMVRGEKGTGKSELGDALSRVSCNATVIGQGSAASLVRLLNEARGLIVVDDLESIGRALEGTAFGDLSQMLKLSYKRRTGRKAVTDKSGKTMVFDFYGPKVINNTRGVDPILGSRMLHIHTRKMPEGIRGKFGGGGEPEDVIQLRDELHVWGMANARRVHSNYLSIMESKWDRQEEIFAPLRAIAILSGDDAVKDSLEVALERQSARRQRIHEPVEILKEAIKSCILQGAIGKLSGAQVKLECQLVIEQNQDHSTTRDSRPWAQPEWIGQQLVALGIRAPGSGVTRARLYGNITRIYELRTGYVNEIIAAAPAVSIPKSGESPFSFCEDTICGKCPYEYVCSVAVPGLKEAKAQRRGKSGHRLQDSELLGAAEG